MSEWKEYKLGEIVTWGNGKERPKDKGTIPVYGGNGVLDYTNRGNYDGETVIIGRVGAYCGSVYYTNQPIWVSDNALAAKPQNGNDAKFFYYFLRHLNLNGYAEGSTHPLVTQRLLNSINVVIPSLDEQKRIAEVLSSLDDKIDLLHRENATLEALAETLFRHYFIENPNPTWKEGKLGDYVEIKRGGSPRPINDYLSPTGYRWLKISDVTNLNSPYIFQTKEYIKESGLNKTVYLEEGALVLSNSATPGIPKILCVDSCIHDGWLYFPKAFFSNNYLYLFFKSIRQDLINLGNGSIFTNLKTEILKDYKICVPDDNSLVEFERNVNPMFEKINQNTRQIISLSSQRDTLLPRLMSGEIKIERIGYGK